MNAEFQGKRILITGAGKGIGRALATMAAAEGATIVALSRSATDLATLHHATGAETHTIDLEHTEAITTLMATLAPVDYLINNAGIARLAPFTETTLTQLDQIMAVNLRAPFLIAQSVVRDWLSRNHQGAIVNVSSIASLWGTPDHVAYAASKAALDSMTLTMANELGPFGIRTNSINPVITLTPMGERAWSDPAKSTPMLTRIPLRRFAKPEEIASVAMFLLSAAASMINGVIMPIDGGFRAG
ncbi:SDR family oxidoreductase [Acidiphilium sp. PA]|uniref:SDR family oxidoreductase n=1 Tax=Acidiphilium sp. PA TaxID=2871705 RepID=UPI0022434A4B|nr:SDR family oxidoreductase [Acidiphilium sp. PA]MCW8307962.1 SDR family oxidoreductase [Acidiphilium sp. PA]